MVFFAFGKIAAGWRGGNEKSIRGKLLEEEASDPDRGDADRGRAAAAGATSGPTATFLHPSLSLRAQLSPQERCLVSRKDEIREIEGSVELGGKKKKTGEKKSKPVLLSAPHSSQTKLYMLKCLLGKDFPHIVLLSRSLLVNPCNERYVRGFSPPPRLPLPGTTAMSSPEDADLT